MSTPTIEVKEVSPLDPIAKPLFDALHFEYSSRYRDFLPDGEDSANDELTRYPASLFAPPEGAFLLLLDAGEVIGGGAFMRYDASTAELKRIWTRSDQRRRGIAARIVTELERRALRQGYRRIYLTTGFRQPEAVGLYRRQGYEPLYDLSIAPEVHLRLPFGKDLIEPGSVESLADLRAPGPLGFPKADEPELATANP